MTSRNIFILLFVFGAAYFMAACESPPGVCMYDNAGPDGCDGLGSAITCRDSIVSDDPKGDCEDGLINPPASCAGGQYVTAPIALTCEIVKIGEDMIPDTGDDLVYTGKCTTSTGVDYYTYGDCTVGVPPESQCAGTFECLL